MSLMSYLISIAPIIGGVLSITGAVINVGVAIYKRREK
ncbi:hypothetical protein J2S55_004863 [Streptosporangium brasiliense]|uniref:Uncharacterized protein n=1 Tax=Streptosporangium brasiliense TaxID=47480 RepID=A0ABT9R9R4_9ACTN|nr:hypothetical protein [Streptosporangium brasiliense]